MTEVNNTGEVRQGDRDRISPPSVQCPSCTRPMGYDGNSWRCMACRPEAMDIPICATQKCKKPLTKLPEPWNCWICLKCNKHPAVVNKERKEDDQRKRVYLDKKVTEERVEELIEARIAEGIKKAMAEYDRPTTAYPPTQAEIQTMTATEAINASPETYLQKAKRLGVKTHDTGEGGTGGMRKKVDIMADMENLKESKISHMEILPLDEETAEDAEAARKAGQSPPSDNDEFARGLTAKDMM